MDWNSLRRDGITVCLATLIDISEGELHLSRRVFTPIASGCVDGMLGHVRANMSRYYVKRCVVVSGVVKDGKVTALGDHENRILVPSTNEMA